MALPASEPLGEMTMPTVDMVAKKRVKYPHGPGGREYSEGETFEALSDRDAKGLFISGKAGYATGGTAGMGASKANPTDLPKGVKAVDPAEAAMNELYALRGEYRTRMGKAPYHGWGIEELRQKMAEGARPGEPPSGEYQRRDLRAEE